jgi:hypothetical protein
MMGACPSEWTSARSTATAEEQGVAPPTDAEVREAVAAELTS